MQEVWKDIAGYEGMYQVSNLGNVRSLDRVVEVKNQTSRFVKGKEKRQTVGNHGYCVVYLYKDNKLQTETVHRLVAEAFLANPKNKETVNHIDGNKKNNCVENLEWSSYTENNAHARLQGLNKTENIAKGMRNPIFMNKNNTSGRKGVYFEKRTGKWMAYITVNKKMIYLGRYDNKEDAIKAREEKERELL